MKNVSGYERLADVLERAFDQAATGKGAERHADNKPFHQQPMQAIGDRRGVGFILGQSDKKSEEAQGMANRGQVDAAVRELLGAIVYLAGAVIWLERHQAKATSPATPVYENGKCMECDWHKGEGHAPVCSSRGYPTNIANDNEQPHDCCPVCQQQDGYHHPKCTVAEFGEKAPAEEPPASKTIVQIKRFNELPETALKMVVSHAQAELLRIEANRMTGDFSGCQYGR